MQQLSSKNYSSVVVNLYDDVQILMKPQAGLRLMDYLTNGNAGTHVQITDHLGKITVIKITDIKRVEPVEKMKEIADYV